MKKSINLECISTENRNINSTNIDQMNSKGIAKLINKEDQKIATAISLEIPKISKAIDLCAKVFKRKGRIIYIGAGTSGRIGILDASEMQPTYGIEPNIFIGLIAGGASAIQKSVENSEDNEDAAIKDLLSIKFSENDVLIGITASGRTPYVISGIKYAKKLNAKTISISNSRRSLISEISDIGINVDTGLEVITGSTRMKSGSSQKMILNMISTGTMILNGYVYENLMINLECKNNKLKERSIKIVSEICPEIESEKIIVLLEKANFDVQTVIVAIKLGLTLDQALQKLKNTTIQ